VKLEHQHSQSNVDNNQFVAFEGGDHVVTVTQPLWSTLSSTFDAGRGELDQDRACVHHIQIGFC